MEHDLERSVSRIWKEECRTVEDRVCVILKKVQMTVRDVWEGCSRGIFGCVGCEEMCRMGGSCDAEGIIFGKAQ